MRFGLNLPASSIMSGVFTGTYTISGSIATSAINPRVIMSSAGIAAYNAGGAQTVLISSADGSITLGIGSISGTAIASGTVSAAQLANATITAAQLANAAVGTAQIAGGAITAGTIAAGAIGTVALAAGAVTAAQIAANTITAAQIAANTITAAQIAANTITAAQIAANTITAGQIAANTITAAQIAAGTITTDRLSVGDGFGVNLLPNGSFQNGFSLPSGSASGWTAGYYSSYGYAAVIGTDGLSDSNCFGGAVTGPSGHGYCALPYILVIPGRTVTVSGYMRNASSGGSPTGVMYFLGRKIATSTYGYDYVHIGPQLLLPDSGAWVYFSFTFSLASDEVAGFVRLDLINNSALGAGLVQQMHAEDIQVQYGSTATAYTPALIRGTGAVAIDASGITVTNGAITVTNGSSVVIIDGTSDLFKIAATGTGYVNLPASTVSSFAAITLTALGALSAAPAHNSFLSYSSAASADKNLSVYESGFTGLLYSAGASGGATTIASVGVAVLARATVHLDGSSQAVITWGGDNSQGAAVVIYIRYYIFKEAAM